MSFLKLTNKFSSSRNDTRTQVGTDYEYPYNGSLNTIGYILQDPSGDATIPLYSKWSSVYSDTKVQTSSSFPPEYDGSGGLLGYIFKEEKYGTIPLYSAWNPQRQDTQVQNYDSTANGYTNRVKLGYIYASRVTLGDLKFTFDDKKITKQRPKQIHRMLFENYTNDVQTQTFAFKDTQVNSHTFTINDSKSIGLKISLESEEGFVDIFKMQESLTASLSATQSKQHSRTQSEAITKEYTIPVVVNAGKIIQATATLYVTRIEVEFEAYLHFENGAQAQKITGKYYGVHTSEVVTTLEEVPA